MVIRPMAAAYAMGEIGRPANKPGGKGGPAAFLSSISDSVALHGGTGRGAGLYSPSPLFKIMGAVELMSGELEGDDDAGGFGDYPILL